MEISNPETLPIAASKPKSQRSSMNLQRHISKMVVAPSFLIILIFVYGFICWTGYISFTSSHILPVYKFIGLGAYQRLWPSGRWHMAMTDLALFAGLYIFISLLVGVVLAILLDQKIRYEGLLRTVYLYPMALSFIVTGTAWKWILNPGIGIQEFVRQLGFEHFGFDWLVRPETAIYTLVIVAVWQSSGFVMALFLAALRGVDQEIIKAAYLDGARPMRIYLGIILPSVRPVFMSALVILAHMAVKSFDLVVALTGGGPGYATDMPATFMYEMAFRRNQVNIAAASAMVMLATTMAIVIPYFYSELRESKRG